MTHDKLIEAVAKAIGDTTDFDGDRMASRYADSELRDMARAAIHVIAPAAEQETVAKIVAWLRANPRGMMGYEDEYAAAIEAGEWK